LLPDGDGVCGKIDEKGMNNARPVISVVGPAVLSPRQADAVGWGTRIGSLTNRGLCAMMILRWSGAPAETVDGWPTGSAFVLSDGGYATTAPGGKVQSARYPSSLRAKAFLLRTHHGKATT